MNSVAIFSIAMGIMYVVSRFPMVFAPRKTLRWGRELIFSSNARTRTWSVMMAPIVPCLLFLPFGEGLIPLILHFLGWLLAPVLLLIFLAPELARTFVGGFYDFFEDSLSENALRGLAIFGVAFGFGLIYLGIFVL
jgi:uncharacterized protein YjeT (DUF2065 family)